MQNAKCEMQSVIANIGSGRSPGGSSGGEAALIGGRQNILILIASVITLSHYFVVILDHMYHHMIVIAHFQLLSRRPAAGGSLLGIGSDVGGSLRIPAHFSGFVRTFLVHLSEVRSHRFLPL